MSLWYSPYFNTLGFGRRLFLQALDVAVWRPRGIKILEDFSFGAGLLRGDVSGGSEQGYGGSGADYYLTKPFSPPELLAVIREALGASGS